MKLTLGFSPCPNDTFIFDALVNKKIDTEGLEFETSLEDVETLNQWALQGKLDITKLSFPAFFQSLDEYILLNSGSALGKGVGPLLITNDDPAVYENGIGDASIALPGVNTTAHLLFSFAYPEATNKKFMIFSEIEQAVVNKESALGVIIHENRFTYQDKGLKKVKDLGEYWEEKMKAPIPLGGIAISQSVKRGVAQKVDELIRKSLDYAFANYPEVTDYVKAHSQAMSEDVMRQHIDLYVNNYSLALGEEGKKAIATLADVFNKINPGKMEEEAELFL
ncbi:1,4-dihydroxy-6-naphthoate synthase [Terrimonas sp. NA20]|uniref:1,4-dihydroxy-6-naphtoate synthase n=1 Tax=Terrimonas ginsenosidimutans TaxID=2908004 RepID=A0ABS9KPD0_9BACT|nr:1,4-dihydroxy-6-naphthoate synthase [Terrimonas ginsenosidimutans]MCG2614180.1 1,4-dihydroxy-6-naphthoate synthase [Terrimonas ginsenosidimutans]